MTQLRLLLIGSSLAALASTAAFAQTSNPAPAMQAAQIAQQNTPPSAPPSAPAAQGVQMPAPAPGVSQPVTHADNKAAREQAKADKKAAVAQAKANKEKSDAQSDADKAAADARVKDAKKQED